MMLFHSSNSLRSIDFRLPHAWLSPMTIGVACTLCAAVAWVGYGAMQLQGAEAEVMRINERIEQRQDAFKALMRKAALQSPAAKAEQQILEQHAEIALPVLDRLENAWEPRIALLSLSVRRAGHEAQFDGLASDLDQIHAFMVRLRDGSKRDNGNENLTEKNKEKAPVMRVKLHRISHQSEGVNAMLQFTLQIEV